MKFSFYEILHSIAVGIEALGVAVIVIGAIGSVLYFFYHLKNGVEWGKSYHLFRINLAKGILLGLEFLVAGDIVGTVTIDPNLENLYVLALIVLIRTFLSFSLTIEIEDRLPWRKGSNS